MIHKWNGENDNVTREIKNFSSEKDCEEDVKEQPTDWKKKLQTM